LRGRLLAGATGLVLLPLLALAFGIRHEMGARLTEQVEVRIDADVRAIEANLRQSDAELAARLEALSVTLRDDNRVRLALPPAPGDLPPAVLDWAAPTMTLAGLDFLQLQDDAGTVLSSGHFRNEYGRPDPETLAAFAGRGGPVLIDARRADGRFAVLARHAAVPLGGASVHLVAGRRVDAGFLARLAPGGEGAAELVRGTPAPSGPDRLARSLELPVAPGAPPAHLVVTHSLSPRRALLRSLDRWLLGAWGLAALGAVLLAATVSRRFTRPIEELAERTATLDLDRLDAEFPVGRNDEVGALARFLDAMTRRLRASVARLQEAERRATLGELARQVNHDLRNAVTPLRNVVRHLNQVADEAPAELPAVYRDRRATMDSGLQYLESLAGNWRKLAPRSERVPCDLAAVVRQVAAGRLRSEGGPVVVTGGADPAVVTADPVGLRRVVENLVANACESLEDAGGTVRIDWERAPGGDGPEAIRLRVRDTGRGIPAADLERIFDDFYSSKPGGQGLGLSVVRRLVGDFEGDVKVASEPGRGTEFVVTLPASG
jgi:signal transduction histidine kinase